MIARHPDVECAQPRTDNSTLVINWNEPFVVYMTEKGLASPRLTWEEADKLYREGAFEKT